jgi:hypothetical protein
MSLVLLPTQQTLLDKYLTSMARDTVLLKQSSTAESSFALAGRLFVSGSGWLLLSVPNSLVRGAFDAMDELGVELPSGSDGRLNAHISVMTSDELASIGPDKVSERGHMFHYTLGRVKSAVPEGWPEIGKVWFIEIYSPELQNLRKSYGLPPTPKYPFHITIAVRKKKVLQDNGVNKVETIESQDS